jgi:hypothetical protein
VLRPPYQTLRRLTEGFLAAAIARGQLDPSKIQTLMSDLGPSIGLFKGGVIVFTVSGEKP